MKQAPSVTRIWNLTTIGFIAVCTLIMAGLGLAQSSAIGALTVNSYRNLIERKLRSELPRLADDQYLGLSTTDARRQVFQDLLTDVGTFTLEVRPWEPGMAVKLDGGGAAVEHVVDRRGVDVWRAPLLFGDVPVGVVVASMAWREGLSQISAVRLVKDLLVPTLLIVAIWLFFSTMLNRRVLVPLQRQMLTLEREAVVARTTQMLAHDVRKPFSIIRMVATMLRGAADFDEVQRILTKALPEVDRSMVSVNAMLGDIIAVGSQWALTRERAEVEALVDSAFAEVFTTLDGAAIDLDAAFTHTQCLDVDAAKVVRVLSNIFNNAAQAMANEGRIWVRSRDVMVRDRKFVEITAGNSGPVISEEARAKLFEAFFTRDKTNGTGLGLAIAQKVVTAHGGTIWCESARGVGVEFKLTLPAAAFSTAEAGVALPRQARFYRDRLKGSSGADDASRGQGHAGTGAALALSRAFNRAVLAKPIVAVVDDNLFVLDAWRMLYAGVDEYELRAFAEPKEFQRAVRGLEDRLSVVVLDYYFDNLGADDVENGAELALWVKGALPRAKVFVASDAEELVGEAVFDGRLPKMPLMPQQMATLAAIGVSGGA